MTVNSAVDLNDPAAIRDLLEQELPDDDRGGQTRGRLTQRLHEAELRLALDQIDAEPNYDEVADKVRGYGGRLASRTWRV